MTKTFAMFNNSLMDFLKDLQPLLSHLSEFGMIFNSVKFLSKVEPEKNQQVFNQYIASVYSDKILDKNESFFMDESYDANAQLVNLLKTMWGKLNEQDREMVWQHLHVLLVLNRRCTVPV